MRIVFASMLLAFSMTAASARDFAVNDQDQQNIQGICDAAATSPALSRDVRAGVANWCVAWQKRVQEAAKEAAQPVEPPATPADKK